MAAVRELQAQLTLTPTSDGGDGLPAPDGAADDALLVFEQTRVWMQAFPPAERDIEYQQRFAPLGLLEPTSPYVSPDPALATALRNGLAAGRKHMEDALKHGASPEVNGWKLTYHVFDYNLDFFEIGALDDPRWKIADPKLRYLERALSARGGLWGNHGYEAAYAMVYEDSEGNQLDGANRYTLHLATPPPVGAFWSVTMYDLPDFYLVENPIGRYSVGDRTPGLQYGDNGSLTISIQRDEPATPEARAIGCPVRPGSSGRSCACTSLGTQFSKADMSCRR